MSDITNIEVPTLGESISEAIVQELKISCGKYIAADTVVVALETDKVVTEISSPSHFSKVMEVFVSESDVVAPGDKICSISKISEEEYKKFVDSNSEVNNTNDNSVGDISQNSEDVNASPSATKILRDNNINAKDVVGTGVHGMILKQDLLNNNNIQDNFKSISTASVSNSLKPSSSSSSDYGNIEVVRMSKLRQSIAKRLKDSQNSAAILSTFNEIDLSKVMAIRSKFKDKFIEYHSTKLGFMSFFVKASVTALKECPLINAEIKGDSVIYKDFYNIGVAVGTDRGLVVPVLYNAEQYSMADIEKEILRLGKKARDGELTVSEMLNGTFTITNGGVYGSLLSTPIINPPQSAILGMHTIQRRPVAVGDKIEIRPMMYVALSYDHRIVDGKEAVTFLVRIKELLEDPERLLLDC